MDAQDRETLSLNGDLQFRVSLVPRGVTEEKLQKILDARLPNTFIQLWRAKGKNMQGRMSVPSSVANGCKELQSVLKSRRGRSIFIGPFKVHLRDEGSLTDENVNLKRKIAALETKQLEMQTLLENMGSLLQQQQMVIDDSNPFSSSEEGGAPESKASLVVQATGSCTIPQQGMSAPRPGKKRKKKKKSPPHKRMKVPEKEIDCVDFETSMQRLARDFVAGISSEEVQRMDAHTATMIQFVHRCSEVPPGT